MTGQVCFTRILAIVVALFSVRTLPAGAAVGGRASGPPCV